MNPSKLADKWIRGILTDDNKQNITLHLRALRLDPKRIENFIFSLDHMELPAMKYAVLPHYEGKKKDAVFQVTTKTRGDYLFTRQYCQELLKAVEDMVLMLERFSLVSDEKDNFFLYPVYRDFAESGRFNNLAGTTRDKIVSLYPELSKLAVMLREALEKGSFKSRGRTPREYRSNFVLKIVNQFYLIFKILPSAHTKNSHFENIISTCYDAVGIPAKDLSKTIRRAVNQYKKNLNQ